MTITLSFPSCGTCIPYFDPNECDANERHEYADLRANPSVVDDFPEGKRQPAFKHYLLQINQHHTIFKTFGCDFRDVSSTEEVVGPSISPGSGPQISRTPTTVDSYIHVGFAELSRCKALDEYYRLIGRLCKTLHEQSDLAQSEQNVEDYNLKISVETLSMYGEDKGYMLALDCFVRGYDENEAIDRWKKLMAAISGFLAKEKLRD